MFWGGVGLPTVKDSQAMLETVKDSQAMKGVWGNRQRARTHIVEREREREREREMFSQMLFLSRLFCRF